MMAGAGVFLTDQRPYTDAANEAQADKSDPERQVAAVLARAWLQKAKESAPAGLSTKRPVHDGFVRAARKGS